MANPAPIGLRFLSGSLLGLALGAIMLIAVCPLMLRWGYAMCAYDEHGTLYSAPVVLGYTVPDISGIALVSISCITFLCIFAMQLRPSFPGLANKQFCIASVVPVGVAVWIALNTVMDLFVKLWWMHL